MLYIFYMTAKHENKAWDLIFNSLFQLVLSIYFVHLFYFIWPLCWGAICAGALYVYCRLQCNFEFNLPDLKTSKNNCIFQYINVREW